MADSTLLSTGKNVETKELDLAVISSLRVGRPWIGRDSVTSNTADPARIFSHEIV